MGLGQGCWKSFRAETFSLIIRMASKVLLSLLNLLHSNAMKYKIPPSKAWEAFLTGTLILFHFKELKCYDVFICVDLQEIPWQE
jgi:hypothetical protein